MRECGVDMSGQSPKVLVDVSGLQFDLVVTVYDHTATACAVWPGAVRTVHHGFDDPPRLARGATDDDGVSTRARPDPRLRANACYRRGQLSDTVGIIVSAITA
jgi:arsenate reductase